MAPLFILEHHDDGNLAFGFTAQKGIRDCMSYLISSIMNYKAFLYSIIEYDILGTKRPAMDFHMPKVNK